MVEVVMLNLLQHSKYPGFGIIKRRLGKILVDGEFITPHDLESAVERQKKTNEQLGDILISMGVLDPFELREVLSIQKDLASLKDTVKVAAGVRLLLGELLITAKRITNVQMDYALQEHRRTGEKLGEVLVRLGLLMECELDAVLSFQQHQGDTTPFSVKLRLGEIMVAGGHVTRAQLEDVLVRQKLSKKKIGDLLIEAGYAQPSQVQKGLTLQRKLVIASLMAVLSLATLSGPREARADGVSGGVNPKVVITATVREHTSTQLLNQAQELVITNVDIRRGYVEISAASRINVKTNNHAGCILAFQVMGGARPLIDSVSVNIGGREVQLSSDGGWVPQPFVRGGATQDISYRFVLSKEAQPGTYNWPLTISVLPL